MTSHPEFGENTSGLEVAKTFADSLRGKHVVLTGVSPKGIGGATALAIASQQPGLLIIASRTKEKIEEVVKKIQVNYPAVRVEIVLLDLSSQETIRSAAAEIAAKTDHVDILINNAGITIYDRRWTKEHIEWQFGTNHIGPFLFTSLLLPLLRKAASTAEAGATRIVSVSSGGHFISPVRIHDFNMEGNEIPPEEEHRPLPPAFSNQTTEDGYNGIVAYASSKTANIVFTAALQKKFSSEGISSYSIHPGSIDSELDREQDKEVYAFLHKVIPHWKDADQGSATTLVAALDPALNSIQGLYLSDCQFTEPAPFAKDPSAADQLWQLSERLVGQSVQ